MTEQPPTYKPDGEDQEIDVQVAALLDYAQDSCNIPLSLWKAASAEGKAAKEVDKLLGTLTYGDMRRIALLRVVRAMYDKPRCSFEVPPDLYGHQDDVYYFPDGVAFGKFSKGTAYMAASILAANSLARTSDDAIIIRIMHWEIGQRQNQPQVLLRLRP